MTLLLLAAGAAMVAAGMRGQTRSGSFGPPSTAATAGADTDHHTQARQLLARRDQLTDRYRATTQHTIRRDTDQHRDQSRDSGLEL